MALAPRPVAKPPPFRLFLLTVLALLLLSPGKAFPNQETAAPKPSTEAVGEAEDDRGSGRGRGKGRGRSAPDSADPEDPAPETKEGSLGEDPPLFDGDGIFVEVTKLRTKEISLRPSESTEAGVRFIELGHGGWDQHNNLRDALGQNDAETDKPIAGLLADLKRRDLLRDTLVIWGGEFGRTPHSPDANGRDHNHKGYTMWMAGGGVKGGFSYDSTDELGYEAVTGKMHLHDWHATILHLLGLDHEQLTFRHAGRDMRLTEVAGSVATGILA